MMDERKIKTTIRELLEVGGLLKTGEFDIAFDDKTKDAEWIKVHIQVKPKVTTWNAALDQLPPQHPLVMRLLECMSGKEKIELYRLFYVMIKRWTEDDSALPDDQREKLTAICEDMLEALSKAPDHPGQLQPAKFIKCNTCNELVPAKFIEYLADDDDTAICLVCLQRARAVHKKQESEEQPTPIVMLDKKIEELRLDIEERERLNDRPENFLAGRRAGLEEARRLFMHYWKTTGSDVIYEHAAQCSTCGRVAPAHLLKPAADTGKSICMACIDEKRQALASAKSQEKIDAALRLKGSIDDETAEHLRASCHPIGKPPGCEKGFCSDCKEEVRLLKCHKCGHELPIPEKPENLAGHHHVAKGPGDDDLDILRCGFCDHRLAAWKRGHWWSRLSERHEFTVRSAPKLHYQYTAPWLADPEKVDLIKRIQLGKDHGGKNILVSISEATSLGVSGLLKERLAKALHLDPEDLGEEFNWHYLIHQVEEVMNEEGDLRHRVQQAMGRISTDNWDDMINTINNMRVRSGARGKQLFELRRAIMEIKEKLEQEVRRYQDDEGRALDAEERDEHDQHGAFIRGIRAALVFLDGFENSRARFRICVICGKKLLITPPKGPEELPVPGRVVCESCTRKATDPTHEVDLEAGFGIITHEGKRVDVRPLLASICNSILEIVEDFSDTDERSTSLVKHLTKLQERAERAGLVLATKL